MRSVLGEYMSIEKYNYTRKLRMIHPEFHYDLMKMIYSRSFLNGQNVFCETEGPHQYVPSIN